MVQKNRPQVTDLRRLAPGYILTLFAASCAHEDPCRKKPSNSIPAITSSSRFLRLSRALKPATPDRSCPVAQTIPAKQKMALAAFNPGDLIVMYGMVVGEVVQPIPRGGLHHHRQHSPSHRRLHNRAPARAPRHVPDASAWKTRSFLGYHRADGQVGTRNYWIVVPLVFCENRNVEQMREALEEELGYGRANSAYRQRVRKLP